MAHLEVYRHSGRLGSSVMIVPGLSILAAVVLGVAYSYADVYSPIAGYVSVLLVALFAAGVGYVVYKCAVLARCRNTKFVGVVGLLTGLLALYSSWAAFVFALLQRYSEERLEWGLLDAFANPAFVWAVAKGINETGWYSIFGGTPSGAVLWGIWFIEAALIVVGVPFVALAAYSGRVFCETSGQWCEVRKNRFRLGLTEDQQLLQRMVEGDLEALAALPAANPGQAPGLQVDLFRSRVPEGTCAMQIKLVKLEQGDKGEVKEDTDDLTPIYLLTPEQCDYVEALAEREPEPEGGSEVIAESGEGDSDEPADMEALPG